MKWNLKQLKRIDRTVPAGSLPKKQLRFRAFELCPPDKVQVIILGQDPYPTPGKANGLAFGIHSDFQGQRLRSSFANICGELGIRELRPSDPWCSLESWAKQGVLLLNTRLSVAPNKPMSHAHLGWETAVEDLLIDLLANRQIVCLAWGMEARKLFKRVRTRLLKQGKWKSWILAYSHPCKFSATRKSQLAVPFVGGDCFNLVNFWLNFLGKKTIDWKKGLKISQQSADKQIRRRA